jgi:hypothetical protein
MHTQKDHRFYLGRRNFILAMFMYPFLISKLMADNKIGVGSPLFLDEEDGFVILGGWVLLKDDLIQNPD